MLRSIDDVLADVRAQEKNLRALYLHQLPSPNAEQWRQLGDRCAIEATLPPTVSDAGDERYHQTVALAAYCYEQARRASL